MTRKLPHARYEELKALGADLIEDYALAYPLQPLEIADLLGVHVTIHDNGLPSAASVLCGTTDGYTVAAKSVHGLQFQIYLSGATPLVRQRFTLMHEIAHIWLEHPLAGHGTSTEVAEAEANFLAGYLLAPDALVTQWLPVNGVAQIASLFHLSDEAARVAHGRLMRVRSNNVPERDYDRRILASAVRRMELGQGWIAGELRGSA